MSGTRGPVCVAMSGGVDSAVVAGLLVQQGYEVIGVTMQIWRENQTDPRHSGCCSLGAVEDARRVARILGFPHYTIDFKDKFKETVIDEFIEEYAAGRTPNPCVTCNKDVKFDALLDTAAELGCETLATGHYARVERDPIGGYRLMRAVGVHKDQSYVLYMLSQDQMARLMFPLGEIEDKNETRRMATEMRLPVADKPDSQEICFVAEAGGYREFLRKERPDTLQEGEIVTTSGEVIGKHDGVAGFTVGQRRGIGVATGRPLYVIGVQPESKRVIVGDNDDLQESEVRLKDFHWSNPARMQESLQVQAKIRYNMAPAPAVLHPGPEPRIEFHDPVRAVTPGQIAVAYEGDVVVAGGKIVS